MFGLILLLLGGIVCIAAPFVAPYTPVDLGWTGSVVLWALGGLATGVSTILITFTKLYRKTSAAEVFVRTGSSGGLKVFKDGGGIIVPIIHSVIVVSLRQLRLEIVRDGDKALLTSDKFRADVVAQFFVRVPSEEDSIRRAASTFGESMSTEGVEKHVENLLDSALRGVATKKSLEELNSDRDAFIEEVQKAVEGDLKKMGLQLDTVTISNLDMTPPELLKDSNVFDAQGKRSAAEITQNQLTKRNLIEREGEIARKKQDVEAQQKQYELEQQRAAAEADQRAKIAGAEAAGDREAQEKKVEADRAVELARVEKAKAIEVAQREQQQAVEVAERRKEEEVARAEGKRAKAQADLAQAEALREKEQQQVKTVAEVEAAERKKRTQVIDATAEAERRLIAEQKQADASAYTVKTKADADKEAADAKAMAIRKEAEARRDSKKADAEGDKALQLVPVEVKAREVEVDKKRVDEVLKPELLARKEFGEVAQEFELAQLRITKEAEVRVATAHAAATLVGKVEAKVVGTPDQVQGMVDGIMRGMGLSQAIEGLLEGVGPKTREVVEAVVEKAESALSRAPDESSDDGESSDDEPEPEKQTSAPKAQKPPAALAPQPKPTPKPEGSGGERGNR